LCNNLSAFVIPMKPDTLLKMCQALKLDGPLHLVLRVSDGNLLGRRNWNVGKRPLGNMILERIVKK
jgi:hypothetical protein